MRSTPRVSGPSGYPTCLSKRKGTRQRKARIRKPRVRIPVAKPVRVHEPKTVCKRGREKAKLKRKIEGELE